MLPPKHIDIANSLINLAEVYSYLGDHDRAIADARRSLNIFIEVRGDNPANGTVHAIYGTVLAAARSYREAFEEHQKAIVMQEKFFSKDNLQMADTLTGLGIDWLGLGKPKNAVAVLERARAIQTSFKAKFLHHADTQFALARALYQVGQRSRAQELAMKAKETWAQTARNQVKVDEINSWLLRNGAPTETAALRR